jgi:hypothetical protein
VRYFLASLLLLSAAAARADEVILAPDDFLREAFGGSAPQAQSLWLDDAMQTKLKPIFGRNYQAPRLRYWSSGGKTAWILEDIGKEFPITAGFVVRNGEIERARVLIYRESRGGEIQYPGFLKQFSGARLQDDQLTPGVDGISGATLSVWAMQRMARAALMLTASIR